MAEFKTAADIGNRALQHLGQRQMNSALGFNEVSKNAAEISFAYGKLRQTELRRNAWRFAIRRQILRAIDQNTLSLTPTLFVSSTTYARGSIVADQNGNPWISTQNNNSGNDPLASTGFWDPYFGPLSVPLYDPQDGYYAGELVYTTPGDGTYNVYLSLVSGNTLDPSLPNLWETGSTYFNGQVVQAFPAWSSATTYSAGQAVTYNGQTYASITNGNTDNVPLGAPSLWAPMPTLGLILSSFPSTQSTTPFSAPSPVIEWDPGIVYWAGVFVMFDGAEYVSLVAPNIGNVPNQADSTAWAAVSGGTLYMSLINLNIGNDPASTPAPWSSATTYAAGNQVSASDGIIYTSKINGNLNNNPANDASPTAWLNTGVLVPWTTSFTGGGGNSQWLQVGGAALGAGGVGVAYAPILYPIGTGPATDNSTANVYRLPANFLRRAPRDPKAGVQSDLGAPTELIADDWEFEGNYIVSRQQDPMVLRFVADIADVTKMDPMFCEALAARIAAETCETLTQSTQKLIILEKVYEAAMSMAVLQNGIEVGSEDLPMDDWLAVRY